MQISGSPEKEEYYGFAVSGRAGKNLTELVSYPLIINFNPKDWDGSDFFMMDDADYFLISGRVFDAFNTENITGLNYEVVRPVG